MAQGEVIGSMRSRIGTAVVAALLVTAAHPASSEAPLIVLGATPPEDAVRMPDDGLRQALRQLPEIVADVMARSGIPGIAVAVVHEGKVVLAEGFGVRAAGTSEAVDSQTVFPIASISKSISATIAAVQVTNGIVAWDDPVKGFLPDLRLRDAYVTDHATIGDFFAHRSGLPHEAGDDLSEMGYDRAEVLSRLSMMPLDAFRGSYNYANFGTTIAAEAVAAASGLDWASLAERALFDPLGMDSTSYRHADYLARDNRALMHVLNDGRFVPIEGPSPDAQAPAGGVSSNVLDLAEWLNLLLAAGGHEDLALADHAILPAFTPQAVSGPPATAGSRPGFYGYGFDVGVSPSGRPVIGHSGAFRMGASTNFRMIPSVALGVVTLANTIPVGAPEAINAAFLDIVQFGTTSRDWFDAFAPGFKLMMAPAGDLLGAELPVEKAPARAPSAYAGRYDNPYYGPAEIAFADGGLQLILGPARAAFALAHWDGDTFSMQPAGEFASGGTISSVSFKVEGGVISGFTADFFNDNKLGEWMR